MKTINFNDIDGKGKRQTHVVNSDPINDKAYVSGETCSLYLKDSKEYDTEETNPQRSYTAALNGAISANLKPAVEVSSYSLIDGTGLDFPKPTDKEKEYTPNTLTITTGAKAQNWKLNLSLNQLASGSSMSQPDQYIGINAGTSELNLGSDYKNIFGNKGIAFTANLTVSVSGKGADAFTGVYTEVTGIYSRSGINVNGTMKGAVNVKNAQTYAVSFGYGFQTKDAMTFSKDITGKIAVSADSKTGSQAIVMNAKTIDIEGDIKNTISVVANTSGLSGIMAEAEVFSASGYYGYIHIGAINAKIAATAKLTNPNASDFDGVQAGAFATVMDSGNDIIINGAVTKDITATANSKTLAVAQTFNSSSSLVFNSEVAGKITASAVGGSLKSSDPTSASAISTKGQLLFRSNVTKDITATAKGEMSAKARAVSAYVVDGATDANIKFLGTVKGKITANASVKKGVASAVAVESTFNLLNPIAGESGMIAFEKGIDNVVSSTASGSQEAMSKMVSVELRNAYNDYLNGKITAEQFTAVLNESTEQDVAYFLCSLSSVEASAFSSVNDITVHDINGTITASATAKGGRANALAFNMSTVNIGDTEAPEYRAAVLNVDNVNKNITVTAKSSGARSEAFAAAVGNTMLISMTSQSPNFVLNGSIKGKITVTATAKDKAYACGIYAEKGTFGLGSFSLGTINVTANGNEASRAIGLRFSKLEMDECATGSGTITGNLSVTCKNGEAEGIIMESISAGTFTGKTLAMNVKVTGKEACAIQLGKDEGELGPGFMSATVLSGTVSAVTTDKKNGKAFAIKGGNATNDYVNILGGAKITGDIDLGTQEGYENDQLYIHAGANVKGNISNVEEVWFVLDDASTAKKAMWQGDFDEDFLSNVNAKLGISAYYGEEGTFTLFQSVNTTADEFMSFAGNIVLKIDGVEKNFEGISCAFEDYDYTLGFKNGKKGGTVTLNITKSSKD